MLITPALPDVAAPEPIEIEPLVPELVVPELNTSTPLTPCALEIADPTDNPPRVVARP